MCFIQVTIICRLNGVENIQYFGTTISCAGYISYPNVYQPRLLDKHEIDLNAELAIPRLEFRGSLGPKKANITF